MAIPTGATPKEAVKQFFRAVAYGNLGLAWTSLDDNGKQELREVLKAYCAKMDAEMWDKGVSTLKKATKVLKEKREFILAQPALAAAPVPLEKITPHWDAVVGLLDSILNGDAGSLQTLASADPGKLLANEGAKIMNIAFTIMAEVAGKSRDEFIQEHLDSIQYEVMEQGDVATVTYSAPFMLNPDTVRVRKFGDAYRVIEDDPVENPENFEITRASIEAMNVTAVKPQVMTVLTLADNLLGGLDMAATQEDFNRVIEQAMAAVLPLLPQVPGGAPAAAPPGSNNN